MATTAKQDYYDLLGVPKKATAKDIRTAFRKLARKYHLDLNPGDKSAEEKFKQLQEAYDILSDTKKRQMYDQYGFYSDNIPPGGPGGGAGGHEQGGEQPFRLTGKVPQEGDQARRRLGIFGRRRRRQESFEKCKHFRMVTGAIWEPSIGAASARMQACRCSRDSAVDLLAGQCPCHRCGVGVNAEADHATN